MIRDADVEQNFLGESAVRLHALHRRPPVARCKRVSLGRRTYRQPSASPWPSGSSPTAPSLWHRLSSWSGQCPSLAELCRDGEGSRRGARRRRATVVSGIVGLLDADERPKRQHSDRERQPITPKGCLMRVVSLPSSVLRARPSVHGGRCSSAGRGTGT